MGNGQRALAQTALMMVGASEIGGSRLTLDELSPDSLTPRLPKRPRTCSGDALGTHHDGRHRRPPRQSDGRLGEHFHFHTTRLKGFSSTETLHLEAFWNAGNHCTESGNVRKGGWSGSFPYRFLETPRFLRETGGLGKSPGPALLWESRHYQMRMHYIGGRVLRDFYTTAVNAAGGGSKGWGPSRGRGHDAGGFLPAIRMLVVVPFGPFWSIRIALEIWGEGLRFWTAEGRARTKESWKFQNATGREIYSPACESKADFSAARSNATGRRYPDTTLSPNPEMPRTRKSTLRQKSHDTTHKLGWGVSSGPVEIRNFQKFGVRRRLETASFQAATPTL